MAEADKTKKREEEIPDENIYNAEERQEQLDDDAIEPAEAGFMEGYEDTKAGVCNACGKQIDPENVVEKEVNGQVLTFCSEKCAEHYEKRKALE